MKSRKIKKIMADLAAGHITQKEADSLLKPKGEKNAGSRRQQKSKS